MGFQKSPHEPTLFVQAKPDGNFLVVCLYVDDLIYTDNDRLLYEEFKASMMAEFEMSDLGMLHYFLGLEVVQSSGGTFLS